MVLVEEVDGPTGSAEPEEGGAGTIGGGKVGGS